MPDQLKLYGADWCPDCRRAKAYLDQHGIDYQFIDVDLDKKATALVEKINSGKRIIPTLTLHGKSYTNPDNAALDEILGINPTGVVVMYGADWCPDCRRAKRYLRDAQVRFQYIEVDQHEWAAELVEKINKGKRIIPTILIDGQPHTNPDNDTLRQLLKLDEEKPQKSYDVIIIGGGAAGLTTAIYAQRDRFDSLILEKKNIGGNAWLTEKIENYPGFTNISGPDLMDKMEEQARTYGAEIITGVEVTGIEPGEHCFTVRTKGDAYQGRSIVIATGSTYRMLGIPGEQELIGSGVHFCATCDGAFYRDREIIVIGGGNSALEEGIFLAGFTKKVHLVHRSEAFSADSIYTEKLAGMQDKIATYLDTTPVRFVSDKAGKFKGLEVKDNATGKEKLIEADGAFVFIGLLPNTQPFKDLLDLNERGFIATQGLAQTSIPGIFAAGDVREGAIAQVAAATGEGVLASYGVKAYLKG
ncbi:FAD-dependent oxidoreductase [Neolewinella lacunae]|uniref:FAD-dependent oxidoreductase n=1 Tax=Neolewinella lacunae TaxID=1517758 RepID=A0A923PI32_9BACT|nr:FAD-dependent oxidoreductase [Neolewinella lacunae]MBC6994538.1 FAD-dependent oxidoreductase [Neolewinella lacunae]MDN3634231.1 FAD-dependent oxidoreductase [Neolewinella lacunae]